MYPFLKTVDIKAKKIARMLRKKESTVRSDLRQGREKLKSVLKEVYDFEETI